MSLESIASSLGMSLSPGIQAAARPPRMLLVNVATGEEKTALRNPTTWSQSIDIKYAELDSPGLDHQPLQYSGTGNANIPMELYIDKYAESRITLDSDPDIQHYVKFLLAFSAPRRGGANILGGAPPRVLVIWPSDFALECVITKLDFRYQRFVVNNASVLAYIAVINFKEWRNKRVYSEDLAIQGNNRARR